MSGFDRRLFLRAVLASTGVLLLSPFGKARAAALGGKTVLVVGAGCAGLGAASSLARQGATVIVIEARPHIGGRLRTDWSMGAPFEVGAGWIHGPDADNPSRQLADAVGSKYVVTDNDSAVTFSADGEAWPESRLAEVSGKWERILEELEEKVGEGDKRSLRKALDTLYPGLLDDPAMRWAFSAYTEFSLGAPIEDLSAAWFNRADVFPGDDVVVTTGYDRILGPLAKGLDIRLSTPVTAIRYTDDGVTVETSAGTLTGDYCVCSLPLGVLKAGKIVFDPPLPEEYRRNIDALGFNSVTKLALKFAEPFWDVETQYFGIATEVKGRWNYWVNYRTFSEENILLGLSVGAYAPIADAMTDKEMMADGLAVLRDVWGEKEVGEPTQMLATHWKTDPFALGAYSYPRPGATSAQFDDLAEPIGERLVLCGEHTWFAHSGTTHGAYMTGLRAAEEIAELAG